MAKVYDTATDMITFARGSSATYLDSDGVIKTAATDAPRIEYAEDGTLKGLLIEEQRTNLFQHSHFSSGWDETGVDPIALDATGPDGQANTAVTLNEDSTTGEHKLNEFIVGLPAGTYTSSVFVKLKPSDTRTKIRLDHSNFVPANNYGDFDLSAGIVTKGSSADNATIENVGNGWFRCSVTSTSTGAAGAFVTVYLLDASGNTSYTGDGASGVLIYGAQLEEGSFPTSYIPTAGSTVTRSADIASIPVSAFGYNQEAGTWFMEWDCVDPSDVQANYVLSSGNNARVLYNNANSPAWYAYDGASVSTYTSTAAITSDGSSIKTAFAEDDNGSSTAHTGFLGGGSGNSDLLPNYDPTYGWSIGCLQNTSYFLNGHIKSLSYYPRRLTNAQLQELTS